MRTRAAAAARTPGIAERLDALEAAVAVAGRRVPGPAVDAAVVVVRRARERLGLGAEHTVVALAGPTGAGKSALFNALVGAQVSHVTALRPTTAEAHAAVFGAGEDGAAPLLDWLAVRRRHHVPAGGELDGLVLLDLPDFDSTEEAHRREVDRLLAVVDLLVFVVDPEKYADAALHRSYLEPLADHAAVVRVLLGKADLLADGDRRRVRDDLARLLVDDGLRGVEPALLSAVSTEGLADLRAVLSAEVAAKRAQVERLQADVRAAASGLLDDASSDAVLAEPARRQLAEALVDAAGVGAAADVVAAQHRRDAVLATGWPLLRWVRRWRRAPARDLPLTARSPVGRAAVAAALRDVGEAAAGAVAGTWAPVARQEALAAAEPVAAALDHMTAAGLQRLRRPPRWWRAAGALQALLLAVALLGGVWLLVLLLGDAFLRLDVEPLTPEVRDVPLPTLLLVGGVAAGWLLALLSRAVAGAGARRRARAARSTLRAQVGEVAATHVLEPLDALLADHADVRRQLTAAAR